MNWIELNPWRCQRNEILSMSKKWIIQDVKEMKNFQSQESEIRRRNRFQ